MIDSQELNHIEQRAQAARAAVDAVLVRKDGLFADEPIPDPVGLLRLAADSARDVPDLLAECRRLAPAAYIRGPAQCYDGDCEDGETPPDGQWCPHVEERVATLGDVRRAEYLDELARDLRCQLGLRSDSFARALCDEIDGAYERMAADEDITDEVVPPAGLVCADQPGTPHEGAKK